MGKKISRRTPHPAKMTTKWEIEKSGLYPLIEFQREKFCASTWLHLFLTPGANGPKMNLRTVFLEKEKKST